MAHQGHGSGCFLFFEILGFDKYPHMQGAAGKLVFLRTLFWPPPCFGFLLLLPLTSPQCASIHGGQVVTHAHQSSCNSSFAVTQKNSLLQPRCQLKSEEAEGSRQAPESPEASLVEKSIAQFTLQKYRQDSEC